MGGLGEGLGVVEWGGGGERFFGLRGLEKEYAHFHPSHLFAIPLRLRAQKTSIPKTAFSTMLRIGALRRGQVEVLEDRLYIQTPGQDGVGQVFELHGAEKLGRRAQWVGKGNGHCWWLLRIFCV